MFHVGEIREYESTHQFDGRPSTRHAIVSDRHMVIPAYTHFYHHWGEARITISYFAKVRLFPFCFCP